MLHNLKQISTLSIGILMLLVGCKKEDKTFGDLTPPEKPVITVDVVGKTVALPAGDGSGKVNITVTSKNAINYRVDFGNGTASNPSTANTLSTTYFHVGTRTMTITAIVSGVGGLSSTSSVTVAIRKDYTPAAELVTQLTNDGSKTWKVDSDVFGHFGVGPGSDMLPIWWQAPINDKAGLGIYDDEYTFTKAGNVFAHKTNNSLFGKKGLFDVLDPSLAGSSIDDDWTLLGSNAANYSETFSYDGVGTTEFIQFSTKGHMGLFVASRRFQILERSSTKMFLRCVDRVNRAWYVRLKAI